MDDFGKPARTLSVDSSLEQGSKPLNEDSKAAFTGEKQCENGVRVSINRKEGPSGDQDGGGLEDSEMNGVSSLLQMKGSFKSVDVNCGSVSGTGFGSLLGAVDESKEIFYQKELPTGEDGVSTLVDIQGDKKDRFYFDDKENNGSLIEIDDNEEDDGDLECEFSVGDLVWGKIRSHPWWPGQVYDPSDASDYAMKVRQKGRLLVAYFGDSSFAWCNPTQLKPFVDNFEEMSRSSNSKNFLSAVQTSADEIGKLVELKLACSCVPKEKFTGPKRPLGANAGIKKGVLVPEGGIGKLLDGLFEPKEILGELKDIAEAVSMRNLLECTVLKGWLSAFNRTVRLHEMPMVDVPIEGPVEENYVSSLSDLKLGQCSQTLLGCPEISEDGVYHTGKQKSIAEIIKGEAKAQAQQKGDVIKKGTHLGEQATSSRRKKAEDNDKANVHDDCDSSSIPRKRKRTVRSGKMATAETDGVKAKEEMDKGYSSRGWKKKGKGVSVDDDVGGKEETDNHSVSAKKKVNIGLGVGNIDAETKLGIDTESGSLFRKRKKSKYLSPPYTTSTRKLTKIDIESESFDVSNEAQLGERMSKAVGNCSGERNQLSEEVNAEQLASDGSSIHTPKEYLNRMIDLAKFSTPTNEVLMEMQSLAGQPLYPTKNSSFETIVEFMYVFRSSVYQEGFNYKQYNQSQHHRKRKSSDSVTGLLGKNQNPTDHVISGHRSQKKKFVQNEETKMDQSNAKQANRVLPKEKSEDSKANNPKIKQGAVEKKNRETFENASPSTLFVSFGPGSSLPTKDDLIRIYSKYGDLNKEETNMLYNNFCARVVFINVSDAQHALKRSQSESPFGASNVSFWIPSAPFTQEHKNISSANTCLALAEKGGTKSPKKPSGEQVSQLNDIKHRLEMLTTMLETSDEKLTSDVKSKLQGEIKGLLEKVSRMIEPC